jgi:membrane-bound metal-dependent hydrolase YbcI (DUF457 family)
MLGRNHGAIGVAAFCGSALYGEHVLHLTTLTVGQAALGVLVAAGTALAPDLDETESLGGRANPISHLPLFGGHRTRTHTLLAAALVLAATLLCERDVLATAILVGFMATMGGSVFSGRLRYNGAMLSVPFGLLAGFLSYRYVHAGWWLVAAVGPAYLSHLAADSLTKGGVPLLIPLSHHRYTIGLMRTGHLAERILTVPIAAGTAVLSWVALRPSVLGWWHHTAAVAAHLR